jgi:cell division GTPase FtsZ
MNCCHSMGTSYGRYPVVLTNLQRCNAHCRGSGKGRAKEAATAAISSPLLDFPIERARGVVFNIVGGDDLTLQEVTNACCFVAVVACVCCWR